MKRLLVVVVCLLVAACSKNSPTSPGGGSGGTTRVISLNGNLSFGNVTVGSAQNAGFTISNLGNSPLTVTSISGPVCIAMFKATWTSGVIQPGATQAVVITFTPTAAQDCSGVFTVVADHTSGENRINLAAAGTLTGIPLFAMSGTGNTVFTMPTYVRRVRIQGGFGGFSSNFIIRIGGSLVVNELLGTGWSATTYDGTHLTSGGTVEITNSTGVSWIFTEVR